MESQGLHCARTACVNRIIGEFGRIDNADILACTSSSLSSKCNEHMSTRTTESENASLEAPCNQAVYVSLNVVLNPLDCCDQSEVKTPTAWDAPPGILSETTSETALLGQS